MPRTAQLQWRAGHELLARYWAVFRHAWRERRRFDERRFRRDEAEFLPAALALQETPVSPAPRVAMWLIVCFAVLASAWSVFGKIDIVATAQGRIVPSGRIKVIQPLEAGTVKSIRVTDGQRVKAGDVLIELDTSSANADVDRLTGDREIAQLQAERARALLDSVREGRLGTLKVPDGVGVPAAAESRRLLEGMFAEYRAKLAGLESERERRQAEKETLETQIRKLEQTAPIARQRADDFRRLLESNYVSQHGWLEKEQQRIELEGELANLRSKVFELAASLKGVESQKSALAAETRRGALDSLNEANSKLAALDQEHIKASTRARLMQLSSPVDGVVQQLMIHTVGGVVTPAQKLMVVVPQESALEVEAVLQNKDIGFVEPGQDAAVKLETFPFTKYGTIPASVTHVATDAFADEKLGLVYTMRVAMLRSEVRVEDKQVALSPGMAVTVEVKTGKRRVIEYFLSPLLQHAAESFVER
jgi:hemolysin D